MQTIFLFITIMAWFFLIVNGYFLYGGFLFYKDNKELVNIQEKLGVDNYWDRMAKHFLIVVVSAAWLISRFFS